MRVEIPRPARRKATITFVKKIMLLDLVETQVDIKANVGFISMEEDLGYLRILHLNIN